MQRINTYLIKCFSETFSISGNILEIGSYIVKGQEKIMNIRRFFPNSTYIGCDFRSGPGVDVVADATNLHFKNNLFDCIICLDTFEHINNIYKASNEIYRILKPKGFLVLSSVMNFQIHDHPYDYWRFTPKAFEYLFSKFNHKYIFSLGINKQFPSNVYIIAIKNSDNLNVKKITLRYMQFKRKIMKYKYYLIAISIIEFFHELRKLLSINKLFKFYWD